jgi:hypothetical protein
MKFKISYLLPVLILAFLMPSNNAKILNLDDFSTLIYNCPVKPDPSYQVKNDTAIIVFRNKALKSRIESADILISTKSDLAHKIVTSYDINSDYSFLYGSSATLEDITASLPPLNITNQSAIFDNTTHPVDEDSLEELQLENLKDQSANKNQSVELNVYQVPRNPATYKCLGQLVENLNDSSLPSSYQTSYILLKLSQQSRKYSVGDIIFGEDSFGYLETVSRIDRLQLINENQKSIVETQLANCANLQIQNLINDIYTADWSDNSELNCLGGDSIYSLNILNTRTFSSRIQLKIRHQSSTSFGIRILSKRLVGGYILFEGISINQLEKFEKLKWSISRTITKKFSHDYKYDLKINSKPIILQLQVSRIINLVFLKT